MPKMGEPNRYVVGASGRSIPAPDVKASGAATVARVMLKAEKPQGTSTGHGIRFSIEEGNHAKKINHDAAPK